MTRISSPSRVLGIPELVNLITSNFSCLNIVRLSQVCQRTFNILVPIIWKHVSGAENLLRLINSASLQYDQSTHKLEQVVCTYA